MTFVVGMEHLQLYLIGSGIYFSRIVAVLLSSPRSSFAKVVRFSRTSLIRHVKEAGVEKLIGPRLLDVVGF